MRKNPQKPYDDFPLFAHNNGQWAKKIGGKLHYFGKWNDWRAALKRYHLMVDGPADTLETTIQRYMESRRLLEQAGEITHRHLTDVKWTLEQLKSVIGPNKAMGHLESSDWERWRAKIGETNAVVSLGNHIRKVRALLRWCVREGIIKSMPQSDALRKPTRAQLRRERARRGTKMFEADEIKKLIEFVPPQMKAMVLLGINCALGPTDLAGLRTEHIVDGWLEYPRSKTGVERRIPLWTDTQKALAEVTRPGDDLVFRTETGRTWLNEFATGVDSPITAKFRQWSKDLGVYKKGRGIYGLRHTVQTLGEESGDHVATAAILGHVSDSDDMASVYRERVSDIRLRKVVDYIRHWLFGKPASRLRLNLPSISMTSVEVTT